MAWTGNGIGAALAAAGKAADHEAAARRWEQKAADAQDLYDAKAYRERATAEWAAAAELRGTAGQ